jgi:DNA-binding GntR family transcriptional regulator
MDPTPTAVIVDSLKRAIVDHRLQPGEKLVEQRLADTFGVSRTLVRQALYQLEQNHLIRLEPARGAFVAEPSVQEAKQVFAVRRVLENDLIRQLVQHASTKNLRALDAHVLREAAAIRQNDVTQRTDLLGDFHVVMARQLGNEVLAKLMSDLISRCVLITLMYQSKQDAACSNAEHADIVEAIRARDTDKALALMNAHLDHVEASLAFPNTALNHRSAA